MGKKYWWEEDENQPTNKTQTEQQPQNQEKKTYWWEPENVAATIGNDVVNRVNAWIESNKAYFSDYQNRFANRKGGYEDAYVSDSASWLDTVKERGKSLNQEAQSILGYVDQYKDYLDADWVNDIKSTVNSTSIQYRQLLDGAKKDNEYWSKWESEDDYRKDMATAKDYEAKSTSDLDALSKELEQLSIVADEYATLSNQWFSIENGTDNFSEDERNDISARYSAFKSKYGSPEEFHATLNEKKLFLADAKRIQEGITLSGVINNKDFDANSGYVSTEYGDGLSWDKVFKNTYGLGYEDLTYEYINGSENGMRSEILNKAIAYEADNSLDATSKYKIYDQMNEDEIAIYNYYYAKDGKEAAQKYLDNLQYTLNAREATQMFSAMEDKTLLEMAFGVAAGLDQFKSGMEGLWNAVTGNDEYTAPSSTQMASGMVREDLKDVDLKYYNFKDGNWGDAKIFGNSLGQVGYDTVTTTSNMLPSILTSAVAEAIVPGAGGVVGPALLGSSAGGNAYQEMVNLGYDKGQARAYAALVGSSEAILQRVLGGVSSLSGGNSHGIFQSIAGKWLPHVDKAFARVAIKIGSNMLDEGLEEGLQEILNPWFKNLTLNTNENVNWSEVAYSSLLGALTAGFMEGPTTIAGDVNLYKTGKKLQTKDIAVQRIAELGKTFAADTEAYQLAGKVDENTGAYTLGRLFNEIGATLTEQNISEITEALTAKGMDATTARKNAEALAYVVEGGQLTDRQVAMIEANDVLAEVARTTLIDANTTWNQRAKGYNEMLKALAEEVASPKATKAKQAQQAEENAPVAATADTQKEIGAESATEAETVDTSPVKVTSIADIGKKTIKLEDGSEVNVKDADLSPDDGVRIETIASIDGISTEDANFVLNTLRSNTGASAQMDSLGAKEVFKYGFYGFSQDHIAKHGVFANSLTESQRQAIYETGRKARQKQIDNAAPKATTKQRGIYFDQGGGNVVSFKDADKSLLSEKKRSAGVQAAVILNKLGIGGDIYFFESYRNSDGKLVYKNSKGNEVKAPNGWFSERDGSIHIDLNAGVKGDGLVLFTLAHELTHFIEKWSPKKYKVLADFLIENYEKGHSMDKLVRAKQAYLEANRGKEVSYDEAYSEVIADSMEAMLADGNVIEKIAELKAKDSDLVMKIKQFFDNLLTKIRNAYKGLTPDSAEGKAVLEMTDSIERIQQLFAEALVEASDNFQSAMESVVEENAEAISTDEIITDGAVVTDGEGKKYSIKSMKHDIADGQMFEDLKTYCNWTDSQVSNLRKQLVSLVEYMTPHRDILDMNETYDREGRRFSPYKPNSDPLYKISMDFSTLCSKRLLTQFVIEQLQLRENRPMSAEEQMAIRDMLNEYRKVEKGLQVACAMCYVEAARLKSPKQIQRWLNDPTPHLVNYFALKNTEFNATVKKAQADFKESKGYDREAPKKDMKPADVKELNKIGPRLRSQYKLSAEEQAIVDRAKALPNSTYLTAGNLADLSEAEPAIYNAYTSFVRTATRSKSLEQDEPYYYGDSRRDNGNGIIVTDNFIEAVNRENGMRFSSWSDWRIVHLLDYITAVIENSVRGAAMHGYTKFGDEVRVLGKTGMMFNMSGVTGTQTGLNEDGSLNFSETESIDVDEAIQLREEFPETAGLQCIGVSDAHILALLRSDIIDYVIPYHVSGLNADLRRMAKIYGWADYTGTQNASIDKSIKFEDAVDQENWHKEPSFSEFFVGYNTGMSGIEAMRASADRYVQMCKDRGMKPKFEQFAKEENYWKVLIDRKMINQQTGKLIQQKAVTPTFDFDVIKGVVDKSVENYDAGLEGRALNHIVENWDSIPQRIKDLKKKGGTKAKKTKKAVDTLANQTLAAQPATTDGRLSLRASVEETRDLLAYHNITPQLLNDVLSRNSLLMPSLAVTNKGMTDFGAISLLFDKATIDPSANKQNKLFGADAWTPTQTTLKKNAKFDTNKTVAAVNTIKNRIGSKYVADLFNITAKQFRDTILKADGSIYDAYAHNIGMQTAYAMESGIVSKIPTKNGVVDKTALQEQLSSELDTDNGWRQYKKWLNNISDTVITSYDQATNEDILKNMKAQPATAKTFKLSESGELVVPAAEYGSIEDVRKNKNRLSENAAEATKTGANEFLAFAKKIDGNTKAVVDAINAAFANRYSTADIVKAFNAKGIKITSETAGDLQALYKKAVELPTQYFEAKPGREVGLNEIKAVVMPTGTEYAELKSKLEDLGIRVVVYNGTNESRVEALNSVEELKFSDRGANGTNGIKFADRNPMLTEADLDEYLRTGQTMHTRNKKQRMLEAGKNPILTTIAEVKAFMSNVIRGRAGGEVRAFGKVGNRLAGAIMDIRKSLDLTGNYLELNADDLRESYKRHSTPKEAGDVPLTETDFERIPEYLDEFDGVLSVNEHNGKVDVHIYKRVSDDYVRILAVSSKERKSLQVTKLIGVSSEKFEAKYAKKIERTTGSLRSQSEESEDSNPSTKAQHTAGGLSASSIAHSQDGVKRSVRDSLTPEQQKHFDYNQKQKAVGSALKTLKGSSIKRSTKYGVGKEIGGEIYFHKNYAEDILPDEVLSQAMQLLEESHPGFEYNCLKYNPKTSVVAFQEAPDFDSAREPVVGDYVSVNTDTGVVKTGHSNYIWHHKWNWVKNDYSGFDVAESWNWSKQWLSTLTEVSDGNGIERWNAQLDRFDLPKDGDTDVNLYSERAQEYDSKDTSVKILPATFTKFGLKATDRVLDWGGGQYDIAKKAIEHGYPGIKFEVVDAFNRTPTHNDRILAEYAVNPATVLTINNVLNVIKETDIIEDVIREAKQYLAADGVCYIKIYEGNDVDGKSGNGKVTSSGWQNNQPAEWYKPFAEKYYQYVERVGDILVASDKPIDRKTLPKVGKEVAGTMREKVKEIAKSEPSMRESLFSDRILMGSLFSGGGTLEAGLVYQMLDKEFAVEYNRKIAATYTDNHGKEHMFVGDVQDFNSKGKKNVFYLHASPVCKNFSPASHGGGEKTLDIVTAQATARVLEEQMPQVFTVENVKRYIGSEAYKIITDKLTELGYKWDVDVYKASDYGNATKRERMIIRAVKDGNLPAKPEKVSGITSWGEATRDLWDTDLIPSTLVKSKIEAIRNTPELKNLKLTKLDRPLMIYDTTKSKKVTYAWADGLAPTLTTKCGDARIIMPDGKVYEPTPKFMGRIQGMPDDYKYPKAKTNAFKIIGNGIPTQLTKAVMGGVLDSAYEQTHDGQVLYQDRADESVSNRSLLANAFEGLAQNDIEKNKIQEYKGKIDLINAEEQKLSELNEKIKELSFAKGPRDTKKIRDLQFEARQTANRINTYDKQLLRLEASKPLQDVLAREKQKAYKKAEQRGKDALNAYKERAAKTQRELLEKWQESRKKGIESREKTAMKHKIQRVVGELNQLLLNGDKTRHVPENLKKAVADALALVNMDTVGAEERAAKYAALIAKETDPDKIDAYTVTMENILRQGEKMGQRLKDLRDAYEEISESDDPDIANAYDPVIAGSLKELAQSIGNTSLRNMTIEQLQDVYDMYKMVLTRVRDANKSFLNDKKEAISSLASRVVGEVKQVGGEHKYRAAFLDFVRKFGWDNLKPVYAFEHLGSATLRDAFNKVRAGEDVWAVDVTEAREYYLDKSKKYGYDSWDFKKKHRFESASELEFELTLDQILSLYAYSKREQSLDHLRLGGFVFDSNIETYKEKGSKLIKYKVNTADAHQITPEILANITGLLTNEQKAFVDEMQDYLSTVMGAKGNEVTMQMYGVKLFKEKFYFPLKSAKQFMFEQNEVSGEVRIKNSGFTNKVVAKANNPVILNNFMDVWAGHVNDMSMYHAFVLPLEDFNRIFNYNSPKQDGVPPVSVKGTIQNAYSPAAVNYVRQLITDLNGGARSDSTTGIINKMIGLFKKGSVFASLSVVVQQPSAIARAAAVVDTKYFIGPKVDHKRHKALWSEVKKYAPVAIIKEMGYFDTNMGKSTQDFITGKEYSGFKDKMKALVTDGNYRDEVLSKAPALADEIAWCGIWEAVKRETKAKNPGMDVKSEEFLKMAGERFTEVIVKTQVYDSVLSRSGMMRSKDTGMKMATAFMAEPTTSINMVADALLQGKRGNRKYARAAIGAVIASQILNSILVSFVYAGRDDDEDETYLEKYIGTLTGEVLDSLNPATYIPFIKDIVSIVQGYEVERSDMSVISDLWKSVENLKKDTVSPYRKVEGFVGSIAQVFGLPVKNIMRDARGIYQTIMSFVNGEQTTGAGIGYAVKSALPELFGGGDVSKQQQLYDAYLSGDATQIARVASRFEDQKAVNAAMRSAIKDHYEAGDIDNETAEQYLVEFGGMEADDAYWKVAEWAYENESGEDFHKYNDFYEAVQTGKNLKVVIQKYTDNGVEKKTLASQITSYFKPLYKEMSKTERAAIKGYLLNAYALLGYNRSEKSKDIDKWLKD